MQLKGLVRFFTIVLILISLYVLSFTFFVKRHEKKMKAIAENYVKANYKTPEEKFPNNPDSQSVYRDHLERIKAERYRVLLDSTKDDVVTYGITGAVSYQKAKSEELNLGLDLQGGMNVTLEIDMTGLLRTLANDTKDPIFNQALQNATNRKANSDENLVRLFVEEYKKLNPDGKLAPLFAASNSGIRISDSDAEVSRILNERAKNAFDNTFNVMTTRIDQFGVAQPTINPDADKAIVTVELPGIEDKDRIKRLLQSSANLQFWEVFNLQDLSTGFNKADPILYAQLGGKSAPATDTANKLKPIGSDTATAKNDTVPKRDSQQGQGQLAKYGGDSTSGKDSGTAQTATSAEAEAKKHFNGYIQFAQPYRDRKDPNKTSLPAHIGYVLAKDTSRLNSFFAQTAIKQAFLPFQPTWMYGKPEKDAGKGSNAVLALYAINTKGKTKADVEGEAISQANANFDQMGTAVVSMSMTTTGTTAWAKMTTANQGKPIAIVMDNIVYSAPFVNEPIENGSSEIRGNFSLQEAQDLSKMLDVGKYPAPARIVSEQQVGPTLSGEAMKGGIMAFGISFLVIFLLMLIYYNTSGWIANIALILNLLFTVGVLTALGATLTAPGIAGLVLTIGMAVDTNVIIYERIKEELTRGKGYIPAISEGYRRSLPPVLDGHITTLLTAIILFYFGLGPVKGFATTQIIGILLSLFCGILVSRWISDIFTNKKRHLEYFTGISRRIFKHAKYKFIEFRKVAYIISFVVLGLGIASFINGFDYGVEFDGGRSYTVRFDRNVASQTDEIRKELGVVLQGEPVIKTVNDNATLNITTDYLITNPGPEVDSTVAVQLYSGLKKHLPANLSQEDFISTTGRDELGVLDFKKVLPTISDDLKKGAVNATIFAIIAIFLYIFIRFRDWRYSLGTIVALLHDVLVTMIVFSFARSIVPFPLEIDQHFIAALLTVIGFSMNDTVIVFDRIREHRKLSPMMPLPETINKAINETLSRTIMTSLTVFLTILILFLVGGEVTRGFAFAMLIGVITGIYSSIFVAAPILVDLTPKRLHIGGPKTASKTEVQKKPATTA
jgi:SecD/SecF fusion protein